MYPDAAPASPGLTKNQPDAEASNVTGRKRQRQPVTTPYNGQMQLELPLVLKTDEKKRAVYMSFLKRLLTKVVSLFYSHEKGGPDNAGANLTTAPWTGAARKGLTISILLAELDSDISSDKEISQWIRDSSFNVTAEETQTMRLDRVLQTFLFIALTLGFISHSGRGPIVFTLSSTKLPVPFPVIIDDLISFLTEVLSEEAVSGPLPTELPKSTVAVDLNLFIETERDELYFASLSRMLKTGGHKLKSKLKPENIGVLLPGEFLPGQKRVLKENVALQVAEKSNHLYTWKDAGDPVFVRRKKSSVTTMLSRSIRPRNRCPFANEELFYSAWDTNFYTGKCEEVLQNEYYNQLENSLNNHNRRRQLSLKKIEINKRKKANDTKDSFYFAAFLQAELDAGECLGKLSTLRSSVIDTYKTHAKKLQQHAASSQEALRRYKGHASRASGKTASARQERQKSSSGVRRTSTGSNGFAHSKRSLQGSADDGDRDRDPIIKKEERYGGCFNDMKEEGMSSKRTREPRMYFNSVLGLINKPKTVLRNQEDLKRYVHTLPLDAEAVKHQFTDASQKLIPVQKSVQRENTRRVSIPVSKFHVFSRTEEEKVYFQQRNSLGSIETSDLLLVSTIKYILAELVYRIVKERKGLGSSSCRASPQESSSEENTDDEFYLNVHDEYLNQTVVSVTDARSVSSPGSEVLPVKPTKRRRSLKVKRNSFVTKK